MRTIFLLALILGLAAVGESFSQTVSQAAKPSREHVEIFEVITKWADGMRRGEASVLGQIYSDQLLITASDDSLRGKAEEMKYLRPNDPSNPIVTFDDVTVRTFGNTAVVTGVQRRKITMQHPTKGEHTTTLGFRFSAVFVKGQGKWQLELLHLNRGK